MTLEQLQGRRARLVRELVQARGHPTPEEDRIDRLARDIDEMDRALASDVATAVAPLDTLRQPGFSMLLGGSR